MKKIMLAVLFSLFAFSAQAQSQNLVCVVSKHFSGDTTKYNTQTGQLDVTGKWNRTDTETAVLVLNRYHSTLKYDGREYTKVESFRTTDNKITIQFKGFFGPRVELDRYTGQVKFRGWDGICQKQTQKLF